MEKVYSRPKSLKNVSSTYCPGCLHGVAHNLIAETLDDFGLREKTVAFLPVGCSGLGLMYWNVDNIACSHGRAPAAATGYKRMMPDTMVFTYQGDGDLASIGLAEIMHCANRGEKIITFFVNNGVYGMTGGQMAPTTLIGQKTTTSTRGRDVESTGYPLKMCELISQLEAPVYVARFALNSPKNIKKAQKGIRKAFELQMAGAGYVFIELLSNCPTCWGMSAVDSLKWMAENSIPYFPLGEYKVPEGEEDNGK
jgi:2-oxoglutarate ferredoxin oxidoreductase subunit beta